jgi:hypothetical protein
MESGIHDIFKEFTIRGGNRNIPSGGCKMMSGDIQKVEISFL